MSAFGESERGVHSVRISMDEQHAHARVPASGKRVLTSSSTNIKSGLSSLCRLINTHHHSLLFIFIFYDHHVASLMLHQLIVRLWDSYVSEDDDDGFSVFHVYVCAAFLVKFANQIKVCVASMVN